MAQAARKTDPALSERVKAGVTASDHGGQAGQWSARKAQIAVQVYRRAGGGYIGRKSADNHLAEWTREAWGTKSGRPSAETGERYLPRDARTALTEAEYRRTSDKKRADSAAGHQHSAQPADVAARTAAVRLGHESRAALLERARARGIPGRSRMPRGDLIAALAAS